MVHCIILLRDYRLYNFSKIIVLLSLKIDTVIENRADSDEMPLIWVFTVKVSHRISHFGYVSMGIYVWHLRMFDKYQLIPQGGALFFSAHVGSDPASTVHPKKLSGISSTPPKKLKF